MRDVVIVPGCRFNLDGTPVDRMYVRLCTAAALLAELPPNPILLLTGGPNGRPQSESSSAERYIKENDLIDSSIEIWLEERAMNTVENVCYSRLLVDNRIPSPEDVHITLVSDIYHLRFNAAGELAFQGPRFSVAHRTAPYRDLKRSHEGLVRGERQGFLAMNTAFTLAHGDIARVPEFYKLAAAIVKNPTSITPSPTPGSISPPSPDEMAASNMK